MSFFNEILTFESKSAYDFAYDLSMRKNFSTPKIYTANGDLKKRWYVYFSFRNPETGRLKRITPFYGDANKHKTKSDRMFVLSIYKHKIETLLKKGYNPFEDNSDLFIKEQQQKGIEVAQKSDDKIIETKTTPEIVAKTPEIIKSKTISEAFKFALNLKKKLVNEVTLKAYKSRSNALQEFLVKNYPDMVYIDQLTKSIIVQFLNSILDKSSPRTRNNYRTELSSLVQVLEENEIIPINFVKNIPVLKSSPERHKSYSKQLDDDIFNYLEKKDPILLLYIKFISYNFLRPIEVNRIKVKDINLKERTLSFKAKNKALKTKIIPDILLESIPDLSEIDPNDFLFTPKQFGAKWEASENNKRDHFSKRFKKVVKDHFNLDKNYGLYSFRHTYITKLYREIRKTSSPFEAKSRLMLITGHSTMTALEKYLRDIDAELAEDYSELLKIT
ncbi:Phage integrase family protein [Lutibacter agarilyticus]|uniref:Phage integrase family protein n=1 Tax=Lutibacter agarilyticus TaxID=1109740 RepID=A0A238WWL0_9FLAO|nr:site-specific integrase [Lutibacter agarilyticus]SNR50848.1 Phage integrase family protein [Lutibacter agarilyticus]